MASEEQQVAVESGCEGEGPSGGSSDSRTQPPADSGHMHHSLVKGGRGPHCVPAPAPAGIPPGAAAINGNGSPRDAGR